jgi:fluoride exporter
MFRARGAPENRPSPRDEAPPRVRENPHPTPAPVASSAISIRIPPPSAALAVAAGGAVGAMLRHFLELAFPRPLATFPLVTFAENVFGAFLLGVVLIALLRSPRLSSRWRPFLATGVLGSFTTFSTVSLQIVAMTAAGEIGAALFYVSVSLATGFAAAAAGVALGAGWMSRARAPR